MDPLTERVALQVESAARVGFAAMVAAGAKEPTRRWSALPEPRRSALLQASSLVRTAVELGVEREAFGACNRHRALGVSHAFVGAVVGYYKDAGLR